MAEKINQVHPGQSRADIESNNNPTQMSQNSKKSNTNKGMRRLACVTVLVLFLTAVVLVFALTILHVRNPTFRIRSIEVERLVVGESNASVELKLGAEVSVKNSNFGDFKFDESSIEFEYDGDEVGVAVVEKASSRARSTKKMSVETTAEIGGDEKRSRLARDVELGFLTLNGHGKLSGKVHLLKVIKRNKVVDMKCNIVIGLVDKVVRDLKCD